MAIVYSVCTVIEVYRPRVYPSIFSSKEVNSNLHINHPSKPKSRGGGHGEKKKRFLLASATKNKRLSVQREPNVKITGRGAKVGERGLLGGSSVRFSSTLLCVPCALSASSYYLYTPCLFLRVVDPPSPFSRASEVTWMIGLSLPFFIERRVVIYTPQHVSLLLFVQHFYFFLSKG